MILTKRLKEFIKSSDWIFAKTYAKKWPHEYIVQEKANNSLFLELANHIDKYGYEDFFYKTKQVYFKYDGRTYWHMENIINRCLDKNTYHQRKKNNKLPENNETMRTLVHDAFKRPLYATDNFDVIRTVPQGKSFVGFMKIGKNSELPVPTTGIVLNDVLLCGKEITKEEYFGSDGGVQQDIY